MINLFRLSRVLWQLRSYEPLQLTFRSFLSWLRQFEPKDWSIAVRVLGSINYFSRTRTKDSLVELNERLLNRLYADGLSPRQIVYMSIHDAGSSSQVMLNLLRDHHRLDQRGVILIDSRDVNGLSEISQRLDRFAIIYVDDFSGTGTQFITARDYLANFLHPNVSEFFLLPVICEEATKRIELLGVEPVYFLCHNIEDRPMHSEATSLTETEKATIMHYSKSIDENWGLGYRNAATMVIFYRNAPNSTPLIFRGSKKQSHWKGITPRFDDLPTN